jgi:23S rRNA (uracil1939-C5)-methyltransferase
LWYGDGVAHQRRKGRAFAHRASMSEELVSVLIEGISAEAEGIGRLGGRAVFIPRTIPKETVLARVQQRGSRLEGEPVRILEAVAERTQPPCPVFNECGGCQLLHVDYPAQIQLKRTMLCDALRSIASIQLDEGPIILAAKDPIAYRHYAQVPMEFQKGKMVSGFFARRSHRVVPVEGCILLAKPLRAAMAATRSWANQVAGTSSDPGFSRGWLRHVVARTSGESGETIVAMVARTERLPDPKPWVRALLESVPSLVGVLQNVHSSKSPVVLGKRTRTLWGQDTVLQQLLDVPFRISIGSFFQVHPAQAQVLFSRVLEAAGQLQGPVVDAYCGVGTLAILLASKGSKVIGIEETASAVSDALATAKNLGIRNVSFHHGRVEHVLPNLVKTGLRPAAVVLDPPRGGCAREVIQALEESQVPRVLYVSCHPGTLARDLKRLLEKGFRITSILGLDMFPHTAHLETFVVLERGT